MACYILLKCGTCLLSMYLVQSPCIASESMCRDVSDGDAEVVLLGNPLLDVKLLGRVGISRSARLFRHLARFETAADLGGLMSPFTYLVSVYMFVEDSSRPLHVHLPPPG